MTGYFPINLSIVSVKTIICGQNVICNEELRKAEAPMLSRFNIPTLNSAMHVLACTCNEALLRFYALCEIRVCGRDLVHKLSIINLYDALLPRVIEEPTISLPLPIYEKMQLFDFLRRFINSLAPEMLAHFLSFVTGFSVCFLCVLTTRPTSNPTSNTCASPVTYESYATFNVHFHLCMFTSVRMRKHCLATTHGTLMFIMMTFEHQNVYQR